MFVIFDGSNFKEVEELVKKVYEWPKPPTELDLLNMADYKSFPELNQFYLNEDYFGSGTIVFYEPQWGLFALPEVFVKDFDAVKKSVQKERMN